MNKTQQFATGLMAILMLGTIVLMPAQFHGKATYSSSVLRQTGPIVAAADAPAKRPQVPARDAPN
jgi:hypothetical protein